MMMMMIIDFARVTKFNCWCRSPAHYRSLGRPVAVDNSLYYIPDNYCRLRRAYDNEDVTVTLPDSLNVDDILWLSVWCIEFTVGLA